MLQLFLSVTTPSLDAINAILERARQQRLTIDLQANPTRRWVKAIGQSESKDFVTVTIIAFGLPANLIDLSILLGEQPLILGEPLRLFTLSLSRLEERIGRFASDPQFLDIARQLSNELINHK